MSTPTNSTASRYRPCSDADMEELGWTQKEPTEPGLYWVYRRQFNLPSYETVSVNVYQHAGFLRAEATDDAAFTSHGWVLGLPTKKDRDEWWMKIEDPDLPKPN